MGLSPDLALLRQAVEGESKAALYLADVAMKGAAAPRLALIVESLGGAALWTFCRTIEKALGRYPTRHA